MPGAIVTSTYRYKRPPRKRKAVPLEGPAIVTTKSSRRPIWAEKAAAEVLHAPCSGGAVQPSTPREAARVIAQSPANDDRKPAMATKPTLVTTTCSPATDSGRSHGRYKRRQAGGIGSGCPERGRTFGPRWVARCGRLRPETASEGWHGRHGYHHDWP
jgi:hypothetical protein